MSFSFPQDQRKSEWLKALQMTVAGNHICSTHFSDESFNYTPFGERKCLKRIAVPMFSEPKKLKGRVYYPGDIDSSRLFCNKEEENAFLITKKALDAARKEIISLKAKNKSQELLITALKIENVQLKTFKDQHLLCVSFFYHGKHLKIIKIVFRLCLRYFLS